MSNHVIAILLAILVWWLSTGLVLILCALPQRTFRWSMIGASALMALAMYELVRSAWDPGPAGAYIAFLSALGVWGWIEMTFLTGLITGPRTTPCPNGVEGWPRFRMALQALLYHELTILFWAVAIIALTWHGPNQIGTLAFLILMVMRISAKLNIFLGVPNLTDEFLPERLAYLKSYFRKGDVNLLFPVSIFGSGMAAILLVQKALTADGAGFVLLFALIALAILEHLFMILPIPDAVLWRWVMPSVKEADKHCP
jgi:putative photosynthetic complex assembly protein 2